MPERDFASARLTLPGDAESRSWVIALPNDDNPNPAEKEAIATLVAIDEEPKPVILGAAFVIGASGSRALCMCAAHSIEALKSFDMSREQSFSWYPPPDMVS